MNGLYLYEAKVLSWLDGDTLEVEIRLGFHVSCTKRLRVYGLNCREVHTKNEDEKKQGLGDKSFAENLLPVGKTTRMRSHKGADDKYGRWLAEIELSDGQDFATAMISAGHGKPYFGEGPKPV